MLLSMRVAKKPIQGYLVEIPVIHKVSDVVIIVLLKSDSKIDREISCFNMR